jgi:hypothetical protein
LLKDLHEVERPAAVRRDGRARLVVIPAAVVKHGGAHHGFIGLGPGETPVAPMGGALARYLGVVRLSDQNELAVSTLPHDHFFTLPAAGVTPFMNCAAT